MRIYRPTDLIDLKVGEIVITVSPLTKEQKIELAQMSSVEGGKIKVDHVKSTEALIRFCVKKLKGVEYSDGSPVELSPGDDGKLSDADCEAVWAVLDNLENSNDIVIALFKMMRGAMDMDIPGVEMEAHDEGLEVKKNPRSRSASAGSRSKSTASARSRKKKKSD